MRARPTRLLRSAAFARAGAAASAVMLAVSVIGAISADALPAGTAATPGQTQTPTSGHSATTFTLGLAAPNNVCPGDSVSGSFLWSTYMIPAGADPAILRYDSNGPMQSASGGTDPYSLTFAQPLFNSSGTPIVGQTTGVTTGLVTPLPTFSFAVFPVGFVPPGDYKIGYACHKAGLTERFWSTQITITANPSGGPAQFDFAAAVVAATTTTTTTTAATTTTTVAGGSSTTTTTVAGGSSTTTTSTASSGVTSTTVNTGSGGQVPVTGSGSVSIAVWAALLLVFGRMAILTARRPKVLPPRAR